MISNDVLGKCFYVQFVCGVFPQRKETEEKTSQHFQELVSLTIISGTQEAAPPPRQAGVHLDSLHPRHGGAAPRDAPDPPASDAPREAAHSTAR